MNTIDQPITTARSTTSGVPPTAAVLRAFAPAPIGVDSTIVRSMPGIVWTGIHTPAVNIVGKNTHDEIAAVALVVGAMAARVAPSASAPVIASTNATMRTEERRGGKG